MVAICERICEKGPLRAMYKMSLLTKTCKRVIFPVKLDYCIKRTCGIATISCSN